MLIATIIDTANLVVNIITVINGINICVIFLASTLSPTTSYHTSTAETFPIHFL